jgi:V8-like Glu-specific endopeptidase
MTVAHCVHEPWRGMWWQGLEFFPGRNVQPSRTVDTAGGWAPLGSAAKHDVRLHPNWTREGSRGKPAADAAIIITQQPIGRRVGWLRHTAPANAAGAAGAAGGVSRGSRGVTAAGAAAAAAAAGLPLQIAGYPDNKANGSMWQQCCSALEWQLQGNLLWHDCYARRVCVTMPCMWPRAWHAMHGRHASS